MKNNNTIMIMVLIAIAGIVFGWLIAGGLCRCCDRPANNGMMTHTMPDGTVMANTMDMGAMMASMNSNLQQKTGDAFDKAFLAEMIVHHQGAVDMAKLVLQQSKRPELLTLARDIIAAQEKEIKMMQQWQTAWFN